MLKNMWPQVLQYLMKRVGAKNQVEFAAKCKISRQGPSRYKTGRNRVEKNFSKIAKGTGLTENELGYVYAWHQLDYYLLALVPGTSANSTRPTATRSALAPRG